jgi:hypothetical protein
MKVEISTICWKATGFVHNLYVVMCLAYRTIFSFVIYMQLCSWDGSHKILVWSNFIFIKFKD